MFCRLNKWDGLAVDMDGRDGLDIHDIVRFLIAENHQFSLSSRELNLVFFQ